MTHPYKLQELLMKKNILLLPALFTGYLLPAQITNPAPYCNSTYGLGGSTPVINKVDLALLSNSTTHCATPGYIYYNNLGATAVAQGSTQTIKVTLGNFDLETAVKAWIDFNANTVFEPSEKVLVVNQGSVGFGPTIVKQATFNVPANAATGITRMRVSVGWHFADNNLSIYRLDSCHTAITNEYSAGETEDYDINITGTSGTEELAESSFQIFPNPACDRINFGMPLDAQVSIFNLWGETIGEVSLFGGSFLDISGLGSGPYFMRIKTKELEIFRRFVKM
jgi:hypothetical protein